MSSNKQLRAKSREQLGGNIFAEAWLMVLLAVLIYELILSVAGYTAIGVIILLGPLEYGLARSLYSLVKTEKKIDLADLFVAFKEDFANALLLGLIKAIFIALWSLLLVIPGIIKSYSYSMAAYIQQESENKEWKYCIDESRRIMNGYKWKLFVLDLSFIGWYILGILCFGIGVLWVEAYHSTARANFYVELTGGNVKVEDVKEEETKEEITEDKDAE